MTTSTHDKTGRSGSSPAPDRDSVGPPPSDSRATAPAWWSLIATPAAAARVVAEITAAGGTAAAFAADVRSYDQTQALVQFAVDSYGALDFALNDAGITPALADVHEIELQAWRGRHRHQPDRRLPQHESRTELLMLAAGGGAILNMASTAGVMAHAGRAAYAASKHGIVGLTRSAAVEYAQRGVRINAVAPGPIDAPSARALPPEVRASYRRQDRHGPRRRGRRGRQRRELPALRRGHVHHRLGLRGQWRPDPALTPQHIPDTGLAGHRVTPAP